MKTLSVILVFLPATFGFAGSATDWCTFDFKAASKALFEGDELAAADVEVEAQFARPFEIAATVDGRQVSFSETQTRLVRVKEADVQGAGRRRRRLDDGASARPWQGAVR